MVRDYVKREFVDSGMVADTAWHDEDGPNPHAHILLTMRQIAQDDFGPKVRTWNDKKNLVGWREAWADSTNQALDAHGSPERIDHRTLEAQRLDAEARGDRDAALRLDRPPTVHRGRTLTHHTEAAPERYLRFADAEAERAIAIGLAEETIQLESFVASGAAARKRRVRELDEAINQAIDAIPEATRAEGLAHAAEPSRALPTPPTIELQVLAPEVTRRVDRQLLDAIPEATRAEGLAHAAEPSRALPTPPTIERDVLTAEATRREETRAAAEAAKAAEAADRVDRQLLDAIPEATRAEGLAHAAEPSRALPTPPTIERDVLTAEATRREETRAAAETAEALKKDQAAAAEAARRAKTRFEFVQSRVMVDAQHAAAELTHDWRPAPTRALCLAAQEALAEHAAGDRYAATSQVAGAPLAVGQLRLDLELEILDILDVPKPRGARIPPPEPEAVAKLIQTVQDLADRRIHHAAMEEGLELPAAAVKDTPSVTVTDTPSVTDTPPPPRAQDAVAAAAEAARRDQSLMRLETRVMYEIEGETLALAKRHPAADARLWEAVRTELEVHPMTLEITGAPKAVRQIPHDFAFEIVANVEHQSPQSRRTPPPLPAVIAETVEDVRDRVNSLIRALAAEQDIELPAAAAVKDTPSVTVTDTPSVTDTPPPPRAQDKVVERPSAVDEQPGGAVQPVDEQPGEAAQPKSSRLSRLTGWRGK